MPLDMRPFADEPIDQDYVEHLLDNQAADNAERLGRLWDYFRNPLTPATAMVAGVCNDHSRPYCQAQEVGLPARITAVDRVHNRAVNRQRKEVVIENDIAWRVQTMVDYLFGRPIKIRSLAADAGKAAAIEQAIEAMIDANGGLGLLQEIALTGSVYGFVDIALRAPADGQTQRRPSLTSTGSAADASAAARRPGISFNADAAAASLVLEVIDSPGVLAICDENDFRTTRLWIQRFVKHPARMQRPDRPWHLGLLGRTPSAASPEAVEVVEIISPAWWQRYENRQLVAEGPNPLGRLSIAHVQNIAQAGSYEGLSDVECLVPLQDELNTRLSDRAQRVTYQSFKMYLGKGIDDFLERPIGPGQMWATHNMEATIQEFGSDSGSPSEDAHISQVRQALDKVSGVSPLAAGLVKGNVGNLTSASALRVLLAALLARTNRKRLTYGAGLARLCELALHWLDLTRVLPTAPADRKIEIVWPDPLGPGGQTSPQPADQDTATDDPDTRDD